jgi:NAD(P)-dependent dehydrogenase (short-subunit alcohol dehydrogenase family)
VLVSGTPARKIRPGQIAIGSVGGAVEQFARGVAPELAPKRINVVSPGLIDTPMSPLKGTARKKFYKDATAGNLIPRAGTPDEIAQGIVFAVQNDFITGTTIDVDGGILTS